MTAPNDQPQLSPDGQWKWDGTQWVPNPIAGYSYPPQPGYGPYGAPAGYGPPAGYGAPPPYAYAPYAPAPSQNDGKAIASLVLGLTGVCGVGSLIAIILGHQSRGQARREGRQPSGMALAGVILGYVGLVAAIVFIGLAAIGAALEDDGGTDTSCVSQYADTCQ